MPNTPAALVTGANKGIGFEIVRQLSGQFKGTVYLAARDAGRGQEAEQKLQSEGLQNVKFLQMDVNDKKSIEKARDFVREKHDGLDILINNAGIMKIGEGLKVDNSAAAVKETMTTNFTGLLDVSQTFFPILRSHARVVNIASALGSLAQLKIEDIKKRLVSDNLTVEELEKIAADYIRAAEKGGLVEAGYPEKFGPYSMSKIVVTALSRVQQREVDKDKSRSDIVVNACYPGYCATDLNQNTGNLTAAEGADTPVYLALLPPSSENGPVVKPRGEVIFERRVIDWVGEEDLTKPAP